MYTAKSNQINMLLRRLRPPAGRRRQFSAGAATNRKKVYLASNFGFSARVREVLLPELVDTLKNAGAEVHEPFEDTGEGAKTAIEQSAGWAYRVAQADVEATRECAYAMLGAYPKARNILTSRYVLISFVS